MDNKEFLMHVINEIVKHAKENEMSVDDTIVAVAEELQYLSEIATFENLEGDWEEDDRLEGKRTKTYNSGIK